jgi:mono/diheme cytochrome c family protein
MAHGVSITTLPFIWNRGITLARPAAVTQNPPGSRHGGFMKSVIVGVVLSLATATFAAAQDKVAKGEKVYADQKCAMCHSIGDKGNKKGPLDGVGSKLSATELQQWVADAKGMTAKTKATRKPEMKNYQLPKEDVDALVAYMQTLKK